MVDDEDSLGFRWGFESHHQQKDGNLMVETKRIYAEGGTLSYDRLGLN